MSRADDFLDHKENYSQDFIQILDEIGVTLQYFSTRPEDNDGVGFKSEVQNPQLVQNVLGTLDPMSAANGNVSEGGKSSRTRWLFSTMYPHCQIDGILKNATSEFRIVSINALFDYRYEYELEKLV